MEGYNYDYAGHITYRYSSQGKVCEIIDQEGNSETFRYDKEGRQILHTDRNGNQIKTTYNIDSNLVLQPGCDKEGKNRETRSWEYDSRGQLRKAIAGGFVYTYEYRPDGKLLKKAASGRTLVSCTYFEDGSLKSLTDESGQTVDYGYDWKGQLTSITDEKGERIVQYHHFPDGKLKEVIHSNGVKTLYEYDTDGNISRLTTLLSEKDLLCDFQYDYDLNGNRTGKSGACLLPGETSIKDTVIRYQYDSMNRLVEEEYGGEANRYRYDLCGNRLEKESLAEREMYGYNRRNQVTERVTPQGRVLFDYDLQGNLVEKSGAEKERYCYNPFNQQTKVEGPDKFVQTYLYDGEGLRAGTTTKEGSSRFVFYNGELLTETKEEETLPNRYILGYGVAASEVAGDAVYHAYHLNEQNSTVYITGSQRQVENVYAYDSFGNLRGQTGELPNWILYTGQQYDQETGQYYLRARYYNPVVGRFTQEDVYRGDGLNLYSYCANNPVTYYDPSGYVKETTSGYFVYGLYDKGADKPYYVGITNDPQRRAREHQDTGRLNQETGRMKLLDKNVTYGEARGYEQYNIEHYGTKTGTVGEEISSTNRGNKVNSYDHDNTTRDRDRQEYFEEAYNSKKAQEKEDEGIGAEKCP